MKWMLLNRLFYCYRLISYWALAAFSQSHMELAGSTSPISPHTTGQQFFAECPRHSAKALPSVALGKEHSEKKLSAKASLPSSFCRALGKDSAKCKSEKIWKKKEKNYLLEAHPQANAHPSHVFDTFFSTFFRKLQPTGFKLATSFSRVTSSTTTPLYQLCLNYVFLLHIL